MKSIRKRKKMKRMKTGMTTDEYLVYKLAAKDIPADFTGMVICIQPCSPDYFMHEYIRAGTVLACIDGMVYMTDKFGFDNIICQVESEYFEEHFGIKYYGLKY